MGIKGLHDPVIRFPQDKSSYVNRVSLIVFMETGFLISITFEKSDNCLYVVNNLITKVHVDAVIDECNISASS